jgi:hypothetical protein
VTDDPGRRLSDAERHRLAGRLWVLYIVSLVIGFVWRVWSTRASFAIHPLALITVYFGVGGR